LQIKKLTALLATALTVVALSGCSLSRNVSSLDPYSPSDGVISDIGSLKVRNVLLIKSEGPQAVLIGSFVNSSDTAISANIQTVDQDNNRTIYKFEVGPKAKYDLGYGGNLGILLEITEGPGSMHTIFVSDGMNPIQLAVPVLDGSLAEYRPFLELLD
jgi:hypothetical protein